MEYNQNAGGMPVNDNKVLSIVALVLSILCCNILSIIFAVIAVVKSNDAGKYNLMGQQVMAAQAGRNAGIFSWVAIGLLVLGLIIQAAFFFLGGGIAMYEELLGNLS